MSLKPVKRTGEARVNVTYANHAALPPEAQRLAENIHTTTQALLGNLGLADGTSYIHRRGLLVGEPRGIFVERPRRDTAQVVGGASIIGLYGNIGFVVREHLAPMAGWRIKQLETYDIPEPRPVLRSKKFSRNQYWMPDFGRLTFGFRLHESIQHQEEYCPLEVAMPAPEDQITDKRELPAEALPKIDQANEALALMLPAAA